MIAYIAAMTFVPAISRTSPSTGTKVIAAIYARRGRAGDEASQYIGSSTRSTHREVSALSFGCHGGALRPLIYLTDISSLRTLTLKARRSDSVAGDIVITNNAMQGLFVNTSHSFFVIASNYQLCPTTDLSL